MRTKVFMLALALPLLVGATGPSISAGSSANAAGAPAFEFAPPEGTGMGQACACTTPTGTRGETFSFARSSSGTCLKGTTVNSINNGDMVTCSTDQPRVMYGNPTTVDGVLGLLAEGASTNILLRSSEFENAAWSKSGINAAVPTVTANQAIAPDGTLTADRVQIPATSGGIQQSVLLQTPVGAGAISGSVFLKGNGTSGVTDYCIHLGGGSSYTCTTCTFNPDTWTRCLRENVVDNSGTALPEIGNDSRNNGSIARSAVDVFMWGAQVEVSAYATSYIATTTAAATRAAENQFLLTGTFTQYAQNGSAAGTIISGTSGSGNLTGTVVILDTAGRFLYFTAALGGVVRTYDGVAEPAAALGTVTVGDSIRMSGAWSGATQTARVRGNTDAQAFTVMTTGSQLRVCTSAITIQTSYVCKQVCLDPSSTRCR